MGKLRDRVFIGIAGIVLFSCIFHGAFAVLSPSYRLKHYSYLESRTAFTVPKISPSRFLSGELQSKMEQAVADAVPFRDEVLLANASMQRLGIETASALFGFGVYPAYYGSDRFIDPGRGVVSRIESTQAEWKGEELQKAAELLNRLIEDHPQIRWVFVFPDSSQTSLANPTHDLVSNPADRGFYYEHFASHLNPRCTYLDLGIEDTDEYYRLYFRTDHHWQIEGAIEAYGEIASVLGLDPLPEMDTFVVPGAVYRGSHSRFALTGRYVDEVRDVTFDTSGLKVWFDGEDVGPEGLGGYQGDAAEALDQINPFENIYGDYFHFNHGLIQIVNDDAPERTLLIVCDSFSNNMGRFFTLSYRTVYMIDPRRYEGSLDDFLAEHEVDDVVFILSAGPVSEIPDYECFQSE